MRFPDRASRIPAKNGRRRGEKSTENVCVCVPGKWGGRERIQKHGAQQLPDVEYTKHTHI